MTETNKNKEEIPKEIVEKIIEFFCRHLVALCISYRQVTDGITSEMQRFCAFSGVVICIRGIYGFLTAGHALKDLSALLERGEIIVDSAALADTFGPDAISEEPIPFDLLSEPRFFLDDEKEGLDFGFIALRPYYVKLLMKHGIKAVFEKNWAAQHHVKFDSYAMLGLPEDLIICEQSSPKGNSGIVGKVCPTMIGVNAIEQVPQGTRATTYPRFIGQLNNNLQLSNIAGMSGGPIFGFSREQPKTYWIVAIQSSWLRSQRIVFGCSLPVLAELMTKWIDDICKSGEYQSSYDEQGNKD